MFDSERSFSRRDLSGKGDGFFQPIWQHGDAMFHSANGARQAQPEELASVIEPIDEEAELQALVDDSYRRGYADGQAALTEANEMLANAADRLAQAAASLSAHPGDALCEIVLQSVRALLVRAAGFAEPDADTLKGYCISLSALAEKNFSDAVLHIHPDDRMLLGEHDFGVQMEDDPGLTRGTLSLAHADGWVEQGTQPLLDELDAMIEALGANQ